MIWLHLTREWQVWDTHVPVWGMSEGDSVRVRYMGDRYYSVVLTLQGGVLDHPESWVKWGDHYRLRVPPVISSVVWQDAALVGNLSLTVTVVDEGEPTVWIEGETDSVMCKAPREITAWRLVPLPALSCLAIEGKLGERFWLALVDVYRVEILYQEVVDEWDGGDAIRVVCTLDDMSRHRVQERLGYREGVWCTLAHSCTCTDEHTYIPKLIPYLFVEALAVGDEAEARSYLAPDLNTDWEDLKRYIGEVQAVAVPPIAQDDLVGIVQKGEGKVLKVAMEEDLISDVEWQ